MHRFFIIMGGFHLFKHSSKEMSNDDRCISEEDDEPLHPLEESDLLGYSKSFTMLTEVEIKDKGKSDWFAKSLVLLQMSWFVIQCIAHGIKHFPVTYPEIVTLAYVAMNFVIYAFWWNKPLNIDQPVRVFRKSGESEPSKTQSQSSSEAWNLTWKSVFDGLVMIFGFIAGGQDDDVNLSHCHILEIWPSPTLMISGHLRYQLRSCVVTSPYTRKVIFL